MTRKRAGLLRVGLALWDGASWAFAALALVLARYNLNLALPEARFVVTYAVAAIGLQLLVGLITKLYRGRHSIASFEESALLAFVSLGIGLLLGVSSALWAPIGYPRVVTFTVPLAALILMAAGRFLFRAVTRSTHREGAEPVLVYGAGNAGQQLARLLSYDPDAPYEIVGFFDDDPTKRNLHLSGAKVLGDRTRVRAVAAEKGVRKLIIAIPTADRKLMRDISAIADEVGLETLVMPPTKDLVAGRVGLGDLHQLNVTDLLGRAQIETNLTEIAGYLAGRVVLVTGAGGSIGSELARQVHRFGPKELVMLDRDESGLHSTQLTIYNQGLLDTPNMVLCNIRDVEALDKVFATHQPDVVFHAAALKHLPMLEQYPLEGWKTNQINTGAPISGIMMPTAISLGRVITRPSVSAASRRMAPERALIGSSHR